MKRKPSLAQPVDPTPPVPAIPIDTLFLGLGGTYTASELGVLSNTLGVEDQARVRQLGREFAPWLRWRGLITQEEFVSLWQLPNSPRTLRVSTLSRGELEHLLSRIDRSNNYYKVRQNALFMCALGLGIPPRHAYLLRIYDINCIRRYLVTNNCYTRWAWAYIDKLIEKRSVVLRRRGRGGYNGDALFLNDIGSPMDTTNSGWRAAYGLNVRETLCAHHTLATEFAGKQEAIHKFYKEIFDRNAKREIKRQAEEYVGQGGSHHTVKGAKGDPESSNSGRRSNLSPLEAERYSIYWACETPTGKNPRARRLSTPAQVLIHRRFLSTSWLAARRDKAIRERMSRESAACLD